MFRFTAPSLPVTLRQMGLVAMACSVAALSACGGGNRAKDYRPDRIVSFGDENSLIDSYSGTLVDSTGSTGRVKLLGLVYTINSVGTFSTLQCPDQPSPSLGVCAASSAVATGALANQSSTDYGVFVDAAGAPSSTSTMLTQIVHDTSSNQQQSTNTLYSCVTSSIWVQVIAHNFGLGYKSACPTDADGAVTYAEYNANVAKVAAQVAAHRAELGKGVLVTLMAGQADIIEMYRNVKGLTTTPMSQDAALAELNRRADILANVVKDIISTGARVVLATTPDLSQSPLASVAGVDYALLNVLNNGTNPTNGFNNRLFVTDLGNQNGRYLQVVESTPLTDPNTQSPSYVYNTAACDPTLVRRPDGSTLSTTADPTDPAAEDPVAKFCLSSTVSTASTLVPGVATAAAAGQVYMWADNTHLTPSGHALIGSAGFSRAVDNLTVD